MSLLVLWLLYELLLHRECCYYLGASKQLLVGQGTYLLVASTVEVHHKQLTGYP